ncbi:AraC family transcriptional regulator [Paenibacillus sp. FSL R7-277]|uniref:response regulator n=1 Tax=unclassified Paenibacillus TaxID=185978 RepID=UPI0003E25C3B|nr:response regulator [Paenibacillus sp. FSL R7-277]ETT73019.1 AraC family transcriptional regulator [Paenibacillus sp. FSL R7-277]
MYQLLIVDDETSVVDSLALTIPWEEYGIEEVHRAYSAQEALQTATRHAIDIIITDIRMPEMDGLELIERIRHFSRKIRCIILSGHDEFEYAQKAIQYGTIRYLLKPVDIAALTHAVGQAITDIELEWAEISSFQRIKHTLHANKPLLRSQLLTDLLQNKPMQADILEERLAMLDISFLPGDSYMLMLIRLEEDFSRYNLQSLSLLEFAVGNITEEVFQELFELWHCNTEQGYLVFLIKSNEAPDLSLIDSYAVKVQNNVQKFLSGSLSICLSNIQTFPENISETYLASVSSLIRNVGKNKSYFITIDESESQSQGQNLNHLHLPPLLPSLLESENWDEALAKIGRILSVSELDNEPTHDQLFTTLLYLSSSFAVTFSSGEGDVETQLGEEFYLLLRKKSQLSRQRIFQWAEKQIAALRAKASRQVEDSHQKIASKVRTFIQEHLAEGISLQTVADHVKLHPVYLSKVYKTVSGETIGDYLYHTRMERAVHLLRSTDLKITEVSGQLGFLAPPHFIKIFKKHYGCTPQEYRNK